MSYRVFVSSPSFSQNPILVQELGSLGLDVVLNSTGQRFDENQLIEHLIGTEADCLIIGLEPLTDRVLSHAKRLRFVSKYGVGLDNIPLDLLDRANIQLGWTPGVNKRSVSELVLAFALSHFRNVHRSIQLLSRGSWEKNGGRQLSGSIFGIVGFGHVGQDLARILQSFDCKVIAHDILNRTEEAKLLGVEMMSFEEVLKRSEILSFHVPATDLTRNLLNSDSISLCQQRPFVVNTSRGSVVDFEAAVEAVKSGCFAGYAADVFPIEPCDLQDILEDTRFLFTPHIGGNAREAVLAMGRSAISHLQRFIQLNPRG
jgi:phosphoglycerate dehydrogenase-like enzyme